MYTVSPYFRRTPPCLIWFALLAATYTDCCFDFEYFGWAMIGAAGGKAANFTGMLGKTIDANVLLTPSGDETVH